MPSTVSDFQLQVKKMAPDIGFATNYENQPDYTWVSTNLYRIPFTINMAGKPATDTVSFGLSINNAYFNNIIGYKFNDLRVYDQDMTTPLEFYLSGGTGDSCKIIVVFPSNITSNRTIYIEFGNPSLPPKSNKSIFLLDKKSLIYHFDVSSSDMIRQTWIQQVNPIFYRLNNLISNIHLHSKFNLNAPVFSYSYNDGLNGLPYLRFNSSNSESLGTVGCTPQIFEKEITIFIVCRSSSQIGYRSLVRMQDSSGGFIVFPWWDGTAPKAILSNDGGATNGLNVGLTSNQWNISSMRWKSNTSNGFNVHTNGILVSQRNSTNTTLINDPLYLASWNQDTEFGNVDIAEVLIFNEYLSDSDRLKVEKYLNTKYQIFNQSNFPTIQAGTQEAINNFTFQYEYHTPFVEYTTSSKLEEIYGIAGTNANIKYEKLLSKPLSSTSPAETWVLNDFSFIQNRAFSSTPFSLSTSLNGFCKKQTYYDLTKFDVENDVFPSTIYASTEDDYIEFDFYCENISTIDLDNTSIEFQFLLPSIKAIGRLSDNINTLTNGLNTVKIKKSDFIKTGFTNDWNQVQYFLIFNVQKSDSQVVAFSKPILIKNYEVDSKYSISSPVNLLACVSSTNDVDYFKKRVFQGRIKTKEISENNLQLKVADHLELILKKKFKDLNSFPNYSVYLDPEFWITGTNKKLKHLTFLVRMILGFVFPLNVFEVNLDFQDTLDSTNILQNIDSWTNGVLDTFVISPDDIIGEVLDEILTNCFGFMTYDPILNKIMVRNAYTSLDSSQNVFSIQSDKIYKYNSENVSESKIINELEIDLQNLSLKLGNLNTLTPIYNISGENYWRCKKQSITNIFVKLSSYQEEVLASKIINSIRVTDFGFYTIENDPASLNNTGVFITESPYFVDNQTLLIKVQNNNSSDRFLAKLRIHADYIEYINNTLSIDYDGIGSINYSESEYYIKNQSSIQKYGRNTVKIGKYFYGLIVDKVLKYSQLYTNYLSQASKEQELIRLECQYSPEYRVGLKVRFINNDFVEKIGIITECTHYFNNSEYISQLRITVL